MGSVATPELAPRPTIAGTIVVWVVAAVAGIAIGVFVPFEWRAAWLAVALGGCLLLSFGIHLGYGRPVGFTERVAVSSLGSLLVLGVISLGFGLASIVPG
jgi:hypothetical protein